MLASCHGLRKRPLSGAGRAVLVCPSGQNLFRGPRSYPVEIPTGCVQLSCMWALPSPCLFEREACSTSSGGMEPVAAASHIRGLAGSR